MFADAAPLGFAYGLMVLAVWLLLLLVPALRRHVRGRGVRFRPGGCPQAAHHPPLAGLVAAHPRLLNRRCRDRRPRPLAPRPRRRPMGRRLGTPTCFQASDTTSFLLRGPCGTTATMHPCLESCLPVQLFASACSRSPLGYRATRTPPLFGVPAPYPRRSARTNHLSPKRDDAVQPVERWENEKLVGWWTPRCRLSRPHRPRVDLGVALHELPLSQRAVPSGVWSGTLKCITASSQRHDV